MITQTTPLSLKKKKKEKQKKQKKNSNCAKIEETKRRTNNYFSIKQTKDASLYFYRRHSRAAILDSHEHSIALTRAHRLETFTSGHLGLA